MEPIITSSNWNSRAEKKRISHPNFIWGWFCFSKPPPSFWLLAATTRLFFRYPQTLSAKWNLARYKVKVNHFFKRLQRSCGGGGSSDKLCQKRCRQSTRQSDMLATWRALYYVPIKCCFYVIKLKRNAHLIGEWAPTNGRRTWTNHRHPISVFRKTSSFSNIKALWGSSGGGVGVSNQYQQGYLL